MDSEPKIIINGKILNDAQAMTVRVALQCYAVDLKENGLGEDWIGKSIAEGYLRRIGEINQIMVGDKES